MSKHETWRTRKFWRTVGGTLVEEFVVVPRSKDHGWRAIDGLIILGGKTKIHDGDFLSIEGEDVIVVQTKARRLGMGVLGQAYFSKLLVEKFNPRSVKTVAIVSKYDPVIGELAKAHHVEVVVITDEQK